MENAVVHKWRFLSFLFPVFGLIIGLALAQLRLHGWFNTWKKADDLPAKLSRIIDSGYNYTLSVETLTGQIISWHFDHCIISFGHDERLDGIESDPPVHAYNSYVIWPLGLPVKQYYNIAYYGDSSRGFMRFAVLEDGSVWSWNYCHPDYGDQFLIYYPMFGFILGGIIGLIFRFGVCSP